MVERRRTGARLVARTGTGTACRAEAVSKVYGRRETAVHALRDVTLDITSGAFTAIMGPSGSGKSTLLHCLAALDTPTAGHVFLGRTELTALSRRQQAQVRRDRIGFVFQAFNLVPTLDAIENVTLPQLLAGRRPDRDWLDHIVRQLGLADRLHHRPSELSGGQQQRVALARALAGRPEVIFADEPTGNLDTSASQELLTLLRDAVDQFEQTVITVTHDPSITRYADGVLFLRDGQVVDQRHRPDVDQVVEHLQSGDGTGGDARSDELHDARRDGRFSMRSRRRRQSGQPAPGRPMVGSDDEVEVARQERWLQRIREQFEVEQQTAGDDEQASDADPWATGQAIEHPRPTARRSEERWHVGSVDDHRDAAPPRDDMAAPAAAAPYEVGPGPADGGWLPPLRSWELHDRHAAVAPDHDPVPPLRAWREEHTQDEAPWSRPGDPHEQDDGHATTSRWAPPSGDWPPPERGRQGRRGWRTDTGSWRQRQDDADTWAEAPERGSSGDQRGAAWSPPHDDDRHAPWTPPHDDDRHAPWTRPHEDRDPWTTTAPADDDRWARERERHDAWTPPTADDDQWRIRGGDPDRRAARDRDWPGPDADEPHTDPGRRPPSDAPASRAEWDVTDEQLAPPPRYQPSQPADDRDEISGYHQPDTPPQSPGRNGRHHDEPAGAGRDDGAHHNGRAASQHGDQSVPDRSGDPSDHEAALPPPDDRRGAEPFDDAWSNVWDASSGIDVAGGTDPSLEYDATDHGPGELPDAAERATTSHAPRASLTPEPVEGDDEIVHPVLRPGLVADDQPVIPRIDEPDRSAASAPAEPPPPESPGPERVPGWQEDEARSASPDDRAHRPPDASRPEDREPAPQPSVGEAPPQRDAHAPTPRPAAEDPAPPPGADEPAAEEATAQPASPPTGDEPRTPAAPALTDEPTDGGGTQPLSALAKATRDGMSKARTSAQPEAPSGWDAEPRRSHRGDAGRHGRPRRPSGASGDHAELPAALASLRNTRRPDETVDPMAALQSLQAQLDRLGTAHGRPVARQPHRSGRDSPTPRRDRD